VTIRRAARDIAHAPTSARRARAQALAAFVLVTTLGGAASAVVAVRRSVAYRPAPVYRPVARTAAVVGTAAVTAAAVGSVVSTVPAGCHSTVVGGVAYQECGNVWYRPAYAGTTVSYTVVNPPR
jgi:hypothetical protein